MDTRPASPRLSRRAPLIGAALALAVGLSAGGFLKVGGLFDTTAPAGPAAQAGADDGVITFMTDAGGRIPDYVVGTDVTVGPPDAGLQPVAYEPSALDATPVSDWSTAPPSIGGDILAMGEPASARQATGVAPSGDTHAIDASEVAASGATVRAERPAPPEAAPEQSAADRRDGQAALAAAGFPTP